MRNRSVRWLLLLPLLTFSAHVSLSQNLSLTLKKTSLEKAFRQIEAKIDQRFVYTREMLDQSHAVTINVSEAPLQKVLNLLFETQPLEYSINDQFITVRFKVAAPAVQNGIDVHGKVSGEKGEPLYGATVSLKGKRSIAATDGEGMFLLERIAEDDVLVISNIGYSTKEVPVSGRRNINVQLFISASELDKTIVVAYGTTTRRLNTGSVSKVSAEEISRQPVSNPIAALQGRVPGLVISQTSGVAGTSFKIEIRGKSVLDMSLSRNDPLFIIDGVPFEAGNLSTNQLTSAANNPVSISQGGLSPLNTINPADIESIEVLKDADATAIYGSRGANGVILITTKKAKAGKASFTANMYTGWSKVSSTMPLLNTTQYLAMRREGFANEGVMPDAATAPDVFLWDTTRYTNFKKLLIGNTAHVNAAQVSYSGGAAGTQFSAGANYRKESSVFSNSLKDQIASVRLQIGHVSDNKRFSIQAATGYSTDQNNLIQTDLTRYISLPPNLKLKDSIGKLVWDEGGVPFSNINYELSNPLAELERKYRSENSNLTGNLLVSYQVSKELVFKVSTGYNRFNTEEVSVNPSTSLDPALGTLPYSSFAHSIQKSWIAEPQLQWDQRSKENNFSILLGGTFQNKAFSSEAISATNYTNDLLLYSVTSAGNITASTNESNYRYTAFFGRLHYDWKSRYILNLISRRDGSSRFAPERRFANFGSVGAAWIFASENWFKIPLISFGKLRGSYGITGNDQIGDYRFLNLWSNTSQPYNGVPGLIPRNLYNPDYNWEQNKKLEVALELGFLKDRVQLSAGYYRNRSGNQLVNYTLPTQTGFFGVIQNLPALVQNSGIEIVASTSSFKNNNWNWATTFNLTVPKNKLISFPGLSSSPYASQYVEGASLSIIRQLKLLGVDAATGLYTFDDIDKDGFWSETDYQLLGNLDPKFYGGLSNTISYKGLSLSFLIEFKKQLGRNYLSQLGYNVPGTIYNQPTIVLNRWQKPGDQTASQRFSSDPFGAAYTGLAYFNISNGLYSDASYARLKNAALSWQMPNRWLGRTHVKDAKLYVQSQNLFTVTNYQGTDPETQNFYVVPPLRTIVFGIQVNL